MERNILLFENSVKNIDNLKLFFGKDENKNNNLLTALITCFVDKPIWMDAVFFNVIMISCIINLATIWRTITCSTFNHHKKFQYVISFKVNPMFTSC